MASQPETPTKGTAAQNKERFVYASQAQTAICYEEPDEANAYVSRANYLHGYDICELLQKKSYTDVLLLMFREELPSAEDSKLLERLMIGLINLGPRHPAVTASMVAGVSKTNTEHLLPIGLSVLGGKHNGAREVGDAVEFLYQNRPNPPQQFAQSLIATDKKNDSPGEHHICPGFGNHYGSIDAHAENLALEIFAGLGQDRRYASWSREFCHQLAPHNMGWLKTGLAATVFCELAIPARESIGLFQLICAPGIFAHGVEQTHKPITAMPMLSDEDYSYSGRKP